MRRQFRIDPRQVEHRCDLADGMIIRHGVSKAERIEKLPLILVEPPHHCAPPQKTVLQTRNHRSTHASTDFCNKIGTKRTSRNVRCSSAIMGKADIEQTALGKLGLLVHGLDPRYAW